MGNISFWIVFEIGKKRVPNPAVVITALVIAISPFGDESGHYTMVDMISKPLTQLQCEPCQIGTPPLTGTEENTLMSELKDWTLNRDAIHQLSKTFEFKDFQGGLDFITAVGALAEKEQHHPDLNLHNYKNVTVTLFTHKIKGLSHNDFIMAAKIDRLV
jgi:4a-hydroxytetrahydrobiopterin dehydratase